MTRAGATTLSDLLERRMTEPSTPASDLKKVSYCAEQFLLSMRRLIRCRKYREVGSSSPCALFDVRWLTALFTAQTGKLRSPDTVPEAYQAQTMSTSSENLTAADVTRQAELVAMEYLKSMKCTHTLDAMMQKSSKSKSSSVVASELYAADLDSKKKAPQEFKSILEYMISTSSSSARMVSETSASVGGTDGSAPRSSRRRSSSVSSDSEMTETIWTKADVSRLKKAIKQTTSVEDKNDRWKEIALLVGNGKSKKHCYVKYKELKEEKKSSGSGSSSSRGSSPSSSSRRSSVEDTKSGKALPTAGGSQGEPEKVKRAKVVKENGDALTSQQSSLSATREEPSTPPLSSAPRSSVASELQMEDVEDFDTVHPTASQTSTQNRSNHGGDLQPVSSGSGSRGGGSRGGRAPTAEEIALLQLLLFSDDKKGLSSHWNEQVRCNCTTFHLTKPIFID